MLINPHAAQKHDRITAGTEQCERMLNSCMHNFHQLLPPVASLVMQGLPQVADMHNQAAVSNSSKICSVHMAYVRACTANNTCSSNRFKVQAGVGLHLSQTPPVTSVSWGELLTPVCLPALLLLEGDTHIWVKGGEGDAPAAGAPHASVALHTLKDGTHHALDLHTSLVLVSQCY